MKLDVPYFEVCEIPEALTLALLDAIDPEDWFVEDYRKGANTMDSVDSIPIHHTPLCLFPFSTDESIKSIRKMKLFNKFEPTLLPILDLLREHYSFSQYAAFLAKLAPRSLIADHRDTGNFLSKCHRIHVPLQTNPNVAYAIDEVEYHWPVGKIYEFDNMRVHGVRNRSDDCRIHLVVNLYE